MTDQASGVALSPLFTPQLVQTGNEKPREQPFTVLSFLNDWNATVSGVTNNTSPEVGSSESHLRLIGKNQMSTRKVSRESVIRTRYTLSVRHGFNSPNHQTESVRERVMNLLATNTSGRSPNLTVTGGGNL